MEGLLVCLFVRGKGNKGRVDLGERGVGEGLEGVDKWETLVRI